MRTVGPFQPLPWDARQGFPAEGHGGQGFVGSRSLTEGKSGLPSRGRSTSQGPEEGTCPRVAARGHAWPAVPLTLSPPAPQTLSHSLKMADQNLEKLKTESERLEQHTQKSVNWLLWAMLVIVCFIFISMVLFIRIMPKLK